MCIEIFVEVLQSDGGVFNAAVVGASLALSDAGVGLRDIVVAASAAVMKVEDEKSKANKVSYHAIADPTEDEILHASGVVTIAMMPNWREVTV
jgi:exosome complex component MTR3